MSQSTCLWYTARWAVSSFPGPPPFRTITYHADPTSLFIVSNGFTMIGQRTVKGHSTLRPRAHTSYNHPRISAIAFSRSAVIYSAACVSWLWCLREAFTAPIDLPNVPICCYVVIPLSALILVSSFVLCLSTPPPPSFTSPFLSFHLSEFWNGCLRVLCCLATAVSMGTPKIFFVCLATGKMKLKDELGNRWFPFKGSK